MTRLSRPSYVGWQGNGGISRRALGEGIMAVLVAGSVGRLGAAHAQVHRPVIIPGADHRQVALSERAFATMYQFITGEAVKRLAVVRQAEVVLSGRVVGYSGSDPSNRGLATVRLEIFAQDPRQGERQGNPLL